MTRELDAHWPRYSEDTLRELVETARSGGVSFELDDRPARTLEHTATEVFGSLHALGLSSGTAALHCALDIVGRHVFSLGSGDGRAQTGIALSISTA